MAGAEVGAELEDSFPPDAIAEGPRGDSRRDRFDIKRHFRPGRASFR